MHTLILIKHSKPEIRADVPAKFWNLSTEGRERAARLAEKLSKYALQMIVSSDEPKAMQTAQTIGDAHYIPLHVVQNLHEHDRSNVLANDAQAQFESKIAAFFEHPDDLVYDPYGGSGTTLIACEQVGRRCIITEKLPKYCDLIISRWEGETGKRAERIFPE